MKINDKMKANLTAKMRIMEGCHFYELRHPFHFGDQHLFLHSTFIVFFFTYLNRCCCGQDRTTHTIVVGIDVGVVGDVWMHHKHTRPHPTDAYGTIEFQGSAHPTKAQVRFTFH